MFEDAYSHCPLTLPVPRLAAHGPPAAAPRRPRQRRLHARRVGAAAGRALPREGSRDRSRGVVVRPACRDRDRPRLRPLRRRDRARRRARGRRRAATRRRARGRRRSSAGSTPSAAAASSRSCTSTSRTRPTPRRHPSASASPRARTTARSPTRTRSSAASSTACASGRSSTGRSSPFVSDHGEALGDHGEREHGFFLYRETVRVPSIVRLPGAAGGGRRVKGPVGLVDVAATLLDLAGLPADGLDGVSLRATLRRRAPAPTGRPVYSETWLPRLHFGWSELTAASEERFRHVRAPRPELYDLAADPGETRNLAAERPQAVARDGRVAARALGGRRAPARGGRPGDARAARRARIRRGHRGDAARPARALADPKDEVAVYEGYRRALALRREGRDAEAVGRVAGRARRQPRHDRRVAGARPHARRAWAARRTRSPRSTVRPGSSPAAPRRTSRSRASTRSPAARSRRMRARPHRSDERARATATRSRRSCCCPAAASTRRRLRRGSSLDADPGRAVEPVRARRPSRGARAAARRRSRRSGAPRRRSACRSGSWSPACTPGSATASRGSAASGRPRRRSAPRSTTLPASREGRVGLATLLWSQGRDAEARARARGARVRERAAGGRGLPRGRAHVRGPRRRGRGAALGGGRPRALPRRPALPLAQRRGRRRRRGQISSRRVSGCKEPRPDRHPAVRPLGRRRAGARASAIFRATASASRPRG